MSNFLHTIRKKVLLGDGAMGTMLAASGLPPGQSPELWMLEYPETIKHIHQAYLEAGSEIVQTNTFGANALKLKEYDASSRVREINIKAAKLVREVVGTKAFVAGIVGPTGHFPAPLGDISWNELVEIFVEQVQALADGGADFILLETFSDLGEARAALYAAKQYTSLPVACSLTYTKGRTLTGTTPQAAAVVLEAMGADLLGANCSTGPEELLAIMKAYREATDLPLLVEPNAGMPEFIAGKTVYKLSPEIMARYVEPFRQLGVNLIGACCGSTPEHIKAMSQAFVSREPVWPAPRTFPTRLASRTQVVSLGTSELPLMIGERINPTARKTIAEAFRQENWPLLNEEAKNQVKAGAQALDLNVGVPGLDEGHLLAQGVQHLQLALDVPLVLDCTRPEALEKGLQEYQGKALINSVNGEEKSLDSILPLAKKYGAAVLGLTLDERGIPEKAEDRLIIAEKIVQQAKAYGIAKEDVLIDCLVLTAATSPAIAMETVRAIQLVKARLGVSTVLGVSNVSHGLPQRSWLNSTFLALALGAGLDAAIVNPLDTRIGETIASAALLTGRDPGAQNYLVRSGKAAPSPGEKKDISAPGSEASLETLHELIIHGQHEGIGNLLEKLLPKHDILTLINKGIIPPLEKIGELFAKGEVFLPQLMLSGEAARKAFDLLKKHLSGQALEHKGTIVLGTVKGDVHDIGKNIVRALLENYGYRVIDLGKNVPAEDFIAAVKNEGAQILGLSALMTTTMVEMERVIKEARKENLQVKIIVGGAVVTPDYARQIGADGYGKDAVEAVKIVQALLKETEVG